MRLPPRQSWAPSGGGGSPLGRGGSPLRKGSAGQRGWLPGERAVCPAQRAPADSAEVFSRLLPTISHPGKERAREGGREQPSKVELQRSKELLLLETTEGREAPPRLAGVAVGTQAGAVRCACMQTLRIFIL